MVYRNPYHGYSDDTEYGYQSEQNAGGEHLYGHQESRHSQQGGGMEVITWHGFGVDDVNTEPGNKHSRKRQTRTMFPKCK